MLIGNIGTDPEFHETSTGKKVAKISMATTASYKDKDGQRVKDTQWHRITAWGPSADYVRKYLKKGAYIGVLGRINYYKFESKDGTPRNYTEIIADEFKNFDQNGTAEELA